MVYLKLVAAMLFWGGTFIAGRIAAQSVGPLTGAFGRFAVASLVLLAALWFTERRFPRLSRRELGLVLLMALTGVIGYNIVFFLGLREIEASRAALIIALNPVSITLFSGLIFGEKFPIAAYGGVALSFAGAAVVITRGDLLHIGSGYGLGELFISGCVVMWVAYTLIGRVALNSLTPLVATAYACLFGSAGLFIPALIWELPGWQTLPPLPAMLGVIYLGLFGTSLGFIWYYDALRQIGATRTDIFINLVPVFGVLLGVLFLHEQVTTSLLVGGLLVVSGLLLTNMARLIPKFAKKRW
jgi:drug/metabolite transporter (DMT)-like permease